MVEKAPTDDPVEPADAVDVRVREVWDELVTSVISSMDDAHPSVTVSAAQSFQDRFAAAELRALDRLAESGASERNLRQKASAGGSRSKKSASKATKRANAVGRNPELGKDLENGVVGRGAVGRDRGGVGQDRW